MRQHRSTTDAHALAAAYALDALDPDEREEFEAHLAGCEECRRETDGFRATAARLAAAASQPPPAALRERTLAEVRGVRQLPPRVPASPGRSAFLAGLRRRVVPLALAASLVAAAAFAGVAAWQAQQGSEYERQAQRAEQQLGAISAVLAAPDAQTVHGRASNGAITTVVASARQDTAVFTASGLPAPGAGKTYQLWLDHAGRMVPAGLIGQDGTVLLEGRTTGAEAVGLTLEPAAGSPAPTTEPLLLMRMPA
ncbi:anti-sigma factor [Streptomyces sp. NPDC097619]|uniref:anti-sigma factor n=1 Tax=Streptomyces sp. NPDC097619 TaxID=3157228 RepID=UPI00331ECF7B